MKRVILAILALLALMAGNSVSLGAGAVTKGAAAEQPWPVFRHDMQRTGRTPLIGPATATLAWSFPVDTSVYSPVVGADGTIYVHSNGNAGNHLSAVDPLGNAKWSFSVQGAYSSPAIGADGTIYFGSYDKKLYALTPEGFTKWQFQTGGYIYSCPAVDSDGTVYFGSNDGYVYALKPDGQVKWSYYAGYGYRSVDTSPAIGHDGTVYVFATGRDVMDHAILYAIDPRGALLWSYEAPMGVIACSTAAIGSDGRIYFGCFDHKLYCLNPGGTLCWTFETGGDIVSSPAIGADGTLYCGSYDNKFYAVDSSGGLKWSFSTGGYVYSSAAVGGDGTIYFGSYDGYLYALNSDGTPAWSLDLGVLGTSSPAIGTGGMLYIGSNSGKLYAIGSSPPDQPSNSSPANGVGGIGLTPTLSSSSFTDPDLGDTHAASQWQVRTSSGSFSSPAFDSNTDSSNLTSISIPAGKLTHSTTYSWHVRYQDNHGAWSSWSTETSFTTATGTGEPTIVWIIPDRGNQGQALSVTITGTGFIGDISVSFGPGVSTSGLGIVGTTQITVSLSINVDATPGGRDVMVTAQGGAATKMGGFTVNEVLPGLTITSELRIFASSPYQPYHVGDTLTAVFSVTNEGGSPIALDTLVVGGRLSGEVIDFAKAPNVVLNPGSTYDYQQSLVLPKAGTYRFFCAYHTQQHLSGEDENNWNVFIPVRLEGIYIEDFYEAEVYRSASMVVLEKQEGPYIGAPRPELWQQIKGPWEEATDGSTPAVRQVVANSNGDSIYVVVQYMRYSTFGGFYYPQREDVFRLSSGEWQRINSWLPFLNISAIAVAPSDPSVIYVGGAKGGVYRYNGWTWTSLDGPKEGRWVFKTNSAVGSIAVDAGDPNTVYVGTIGRGIWKKQGEEAWIQIKTSSCGVATAVVASPNKSGVVYAGGFNAQQGPAGAVPSPWGILMSSDGGSSWSDRSNNGIVNSIWVSGGDTDLVYVASTPYGVTVPLFGWIYGKVGSGWDSTFIWPSDTSPLLRHDGSGDWQSEKWYASAGEGGRNPLPVRGVMGVAASRKFPNLVFAACGPNGVYFSPDSGRDWFPILKRWWDSGDGSLESIKGLVMARDGESETLYAYGPTSVFSLRISDSAVILRQGSPTELRVYDSQGRATGVFNGDMKNEMPGSMYVDRDTIILLSPSSSDQYEIAGTGAGVYGLQIGWVQGGEVVWLAGSEIPTAGGAIHRYTVDWDALARGEEGVTVQVDSDGDGKFESSFSADAELTADEFASATGQAGLPFWIWIVVGGGAVVVVSGGILIWRRMARKPAATA